MVAVVQLVEHQVVILAVAGSSPVSHPTGQGGIFASRLLRHFFAGVSDCPRISSISPDASVGVAPRMTDIYVDTDQELHRIVPRL